MSIDWSFLSIGNDGSSLNSDENSILGGINDTQSQESSFEGSEGYFAQGGKELVMPKNKNDVLKFSKWDRTLTIRVRNTIAFGFSQLPATLFGNADFPQVPFVIVDTPDLNLPVPVNDTQNIVTREQIANPFVIKGMRIIFLNNGAALADFNTQVFTPLTIRSQTITGALNSFDFQIENGISPTQINNPLPGYAVLDFPLFDEVTERNFSIDYNIINNINVFFVFTLKRKIENSNLLFDRNTVSSCEQIRPSGNPLGDIAMENIAKQILSDSNYNSTVQYAFAPRPTGNPIADTELLNEPFLD